MDEREPAREPRVAQVREVVRQLRSGQHPLVDNRPRGEARQREVAPGRTLDHAADDVELALERLLIDDLVRRPDQDLADRRSRRPGGHPDVALVHGDLAPVQYPLTLGGDRLLDQRLELGPALGVGRQVADADAVQAALGKLDPRDRAEERVRNLQEDAGAVSGARICPLGATMLEVLERVERLLDYRVGRLAAQLRHERDATRVMLVGGVVEAIGPWRRGAVHEVVVVLRGADTVFPGHTRISAASGAAKGKDPPPSGRSQRPLGAYESWPTADPDSCGSPRK